jgi:hypothetical protein
MGLKSLETQPCPETLSHELDAPRADPPFESSINLGHGHREKMVDEVGCVKEGTLPGVNKVENVCVLP